LNDKIKAGVIGYTEDGNFAKKTLSPRIHNYWLKKYGINGEYKAYNIQPDNLEEFIISLPKQNMTGCNVTLPHKENILKIENIKLTSSTKNIGAVNTIFIENGVICGDNTDWIGFWNNVVHSLYNKQNKKAIILGAGGAAKGVIYALFQGGFTEIIVTNRTKSRAEELVSYVTPHLLRGLEIKIADWNDRNEILKDCDLLVNTTSLGMVGQPELDIDLSLLPKEAVVTDIVYNPLETKLLKAALLRGNQVVDGLGMLLYQAVPGFKAWFDPDGLILKKNEPEVTEDLRQYVLEGLK